MTSRLVFVAFGFAVAVGCSSSSSEKDYPTNYAKTVCAQLQPCCMANGLSFDKGK
jgi:hypothetical protein